MSRLLGLILMTVVLSACATKKAPQTGTAKPAAVDKATQAEIDERRRLTEQGLDNWNGDVPKNQQATSGKSQPTATPRTQPVEVVRINRDAQIPQDVLAEPVLLMFGKMSAKLDAMALLQIEKMSTRIKQARRATVTGYCNRHEIGNADAVAKARATAVKKELVKKGIPEDNIDINVEINEDRHATVIELG
jgi:outer membrane protein OmpA-like peptidoglycan-associated protein